jgi:hypothetical protein
MTGTGDNHVRQVQRVLGRHLLHVFLAVLEDQQRKQGHRRRKRDAEVKADSDPEAQGTH